MASKQNNKKKKRYYKSSIYDRVDYYLKKAIKTGKVEDFDFVMGYIDGLDNKWTTDKRLSKSHDYTRGNIRASNSLEVAKKVKF